MKIAIGCDHGGINLKGAVKDALSTLNLTYTDFGTYDECSCDYPDFALKVAEAVASGECDKGILLCGTGIGISIAANKVRGIRCAHITNVFSAKATAEHNNANIIAMGGRINTAEEAFEMVKAFLTTEYACGRHQTRLDKISAIEDKYFK